MGRLDLDRAATIIVEAAYYGDPDTAERWGISERTIQRYRARLDEDDELSSIVARKKTAFETEWANEIPAALRSALRFLMRAGQEADPKDPEAIHAVAGAFKLMAEIGFTRDVLNARLAEFYRADGEATDEVAAGGPSGYIEG